MRNFDRFFSWILPTAAIIGPIAALMFATVPLSLDGPSHVYNGFILRHLLAGDPDYTAQFHFNSIFVPNWLASLLTAGVAALVGTRWAVVLINVALVLLILFTLERLASRATSSDRLTINRGYVMAILMAPTLNVFLLYGFWGFLISSAFCFIAISLIEERTAQKRRVLIGFLVLLGWWAHPLPVVLTSLIPLVGYIRALWNSTRNGVNNVGQLTHRFLIDIMPWVIAAILIIGFTLSLSKVDNGIAINHWQESTKRLMNITRPGGLSDSSATAGGIFTVFIGMIGVGAFAGGTNQNSSRWQMAVVAWLLAIMYFVFPDAIGNAFYISIRILWFFIIVLTVLAVSGSLRTNPAYMRAGAITATVIALLFSAEYFMSGRRMLPSFEELRPAIEKLPKHSKVLVLGYRLQPNCPRTRIIRETSPEAHLALLSIANRSIMVLNDYEATTGHFPLEYNDRKFSTIARGDFRFTADDEAKWAQALKIADSGTYLLSWGIPNGASLQYCMEHVAPPLQWQLRDGYTLVYEHEGQAHTQLWRRN